MEGKWLISIRCCKPFCIILWIYFFKSVTIECDYALLEFAALWYFFCFIVELPRKKIKYIPESEIETQCDDDDVFYQNSQTYDEWESVVNKDSGTIKKTTQDCATCTEKLTKDNFTNTEKMLEEVEERVPTIVDIHGCKYFGQFVSNELLRFSVDERYKIMQKIIESLK